MELNRALLRSNGAFDSGALNQHVDIVRQLSEEGNYNCTVRKEGLYETTIRISVAEGVGEHQIDIDLAELDIGAAPPTLLLARSGFLIFYSGWGPHTYDVRLAHEEQGEVLNSMELDAPALIVVTPFVPNTYTISDDGSGAKGEIVVRPLDGDSESELASSRARAMDRAPTYMKIENGEFDPARVTVAGDEPVIVVAANDTRIRGQAKE